LPFCCRFFEGFCERLRDMTTYSNPISPCGEVERGKPAERQLEFHLGNFTSPALASPKVMLSQITV
jgi:hypothetical protein